MVGQKNLKRLDLIIPNAAGVIGSFNFYYFFYKDYIKQNQQLHKKSCW